ERQVTQELDNIRGFVTNYSPQSCTDCPPNLRSDLAKKWWKDDNAKMPWLSRLAQVGWVSGDGTLATKFSAGAEDSKVVPTLDLSDREYFQAITSEQTWHSDDRKPFYVQSLFAKTTGENNATLAVPFSEHAKPADPEVCKDCAVITSLVKPQSLFNTF